MEIIGVIGYTFYGIFLVGVFLAMKYIIEWYFNLREFMKVQKKQLEILEQIAKNLKEKK